MILALDVGNTNIVVGCIENENIFLECRLSTDLTKTVAEYAVILKNLLDVYDVDISQINGSIISSVVPQITNNLSEAVFTVTGYKPIEVNVGMSHGLKFDVEHAEVGNDLIVVAVAALDKFKSPLIIFDMGTATTITVIDKEGIFKGVSILPGVVTAMNALFNNASQLTAVKIEAPKKVIGQNTIECMQSGAVFGNASMVDGMIERIEEELGYKTTVLATGGLAGIIIKHCKRDIIYDDSMLLKGLWILYEKNK